MIATLLHLMSTIIIPLGGLGVFLAEITEEVIVPIPSAVILLGAGSVFLQGLSGAAFYKVLFLTVVLPAACGLTLGSLVIYALAYYGGRPFLDRYGKYIGVSWKDVEDMQVKMDNTRYDEFFIVLARIIPPIPSALIAVFAGAVRMPVMKYTKLTFIGAFFKALFLALIGWQVGNLFVRYADIISRLENLFLFLCIIAAGAFVVYRKKHRKKTEKVLH